MLERSVSLVIRIVKASYLSSLRLFATALIFCASIALPIAWSSPAGASETCVGTAADCVGTSSSLDFSISGGAARVLSDSNSTSESITIPSSISFGGSSYPVTEVGRYAFTACSSDTFLTSITIPDTVTRIDNGAFQCQFFLRSLTIPNSVASIGVGAFETNYELASLTLGTGLQTIGAYAFVDCYPLSSVAFPDSLLAVGAFAFAGTALTSVALPSSVEQIGSGAFGSESFLQTVSIGSQDFSGPPVTQIDQFAFTNDSALQSIHLSGSVNYLEPWAFGLIGTTPTITSENPSQVWSDYNGQIFTTNDLATNAVGYGLTAGPLANGEGLDWTTYTMTPEQQAYYQAYAQANHAILTSGLANGPVCDHGTASTIDMVLGSDGSSGDNTTVDSPWTAGTAGANQNCPTSFYIDTFTGFLTVPPVASGASSVTVTFTANADDGIELYVGGTNVIDDDYQQSATDADVVDCVDEYGCNAIGTITLNVGQTYSFELDHAQGNGGSAVQLAWDINGFSQLVPPSAFSHTFTPPAPASPVIGGASEVSNKALKLSWAPVSDNGSGAVDSYTCSAPGVVPVTVTGTSCVLSGFNLSAAGNYQLSVVANSGSLSSDAASITVAIAGTPTTTTTAPQVKTITCVLGKKTKRVRGVAPRCPAGFRLK